MGKLNLNLNLNSIEIIDAIRMYIDNYEKNYKREGDNLKFKNIEKLHLDSISEPLPFFEETIKRINYCLSRLYKASVKDDYYFFDCSLDVYKNTYKKRMESFLITYQDSTELNFLSEQIKILDDPEKFRVLSANHRNFNYSKYLIHNIDFEVSLDRKREYVAKRIKFINKRKNYNSRIFKSETAEEWFNDALEDLNALNDNMNAGSFFSAKCEAIYRNEDCEKLIFVHRLSLKDYILFLNREYNAGIRDLTILSKGSRYYERVEELIYLYKNNP